MSIKQRYSGITSVHDVECQDLRVHSSLGLPRALFKTVWFLVPSLPELLLRLTLLIAYLLRSLYSLQWTSNS